MIQTTKILSSNLSFESKLLKLIDLVQGKIVLEVGEDRKSRKLAMDEAREFCDYFRMGMLITADIRNLQFTNLPFEIDSLIHKDDKNSYYSIEAFMNKKRALEKAIDSFKMDHQATGDSDKYLPMIKRRESHLEFFKSIESYALKVGVTKNVYINTSDAIKIR